MWDLEIFNTQSAALHDGSAAGCCELIFVSFCRARKKVGLDNSHIVLGRDPVPHEKVRWTPPKMRMLTVCKLLRGSI